MANNVRSYSLGTYDEATRSIPVVASSRNPVKGWEPAKKADELATPRLEALESWELRRFIKNPVVLWQHDGGCSAIGLASEVQETELGLEMRINFAAANAKPKVEECISEMRAGLVRGVSVGFDFGSRTDEVRDGRQIAVFRKNLLTEVSLVTLPADEDALAGDNPDDVLAEDEERRARASNAGRELVKHRQTRTDGGDEVDRFDVGRLEKFERTQVGGLRIPARIARTGILVYRNADGTERRELRLAEECFKADSLASLKHAPVTDLEHHRGLISTHNWKDAALGHVDDARADGDYISGDLLLNDARAIEDVESGKLSECSAGYRCRLEWKSGTWKGERYDAIQRDIKYNHVAVLPPGRGRAGADVGLRLDSTDGGNANDEATTMEATKVIIKLDGKDVEYGSKEHLGHVENAHLADIAKFDAKQKTLVAERDSLQARCDAAEKGKKKAEDDAKAGAEAEKGKARAWYRKMRKAALRFLAEEDQDDEEKMDAKIDELAPLAERDMNLKVIRADADYKDFDDKGRSDEYVAAIFDVVTEKKVERKDSVDNVVKTLHELRRQAGDPVESGEAKARADMETRANDAWKKPVGQRAG
jgi:HK97 family phage prohead protease